MPFDDVITDLDGLREIYPHPHPVVADKGIDHVDATAADFIARSPFVALGTFGPGGGDVSPRGGPPGFVRVLDPKRIALGDLVGNRRLDSYTNVILDGRVGLMFVVPGLGETLRVNGTASLTTDPEVLEAVSFPGVKATAALGIDVDEVFLHCAKAFRRSQLWEPETWPAAGDRPSPGAIFKAHAGIEDATAEQIEAGLEADYAVGLWHPGQ
ncbi:MAG TPA: MSMEG_1061 family FMN-dependent PPOX-type flavoprotein [Iamia sp.]|nr:MSMEG_1061 family FMN-dependent PPOX-type flavoprotein [Iamia sp.]